MPIDISTAAATMSMMRNGMKTRKPIWNARLISESRNDGTRTDSAPSSASGRRSCRCWSVSPSTRAAMKARNGSTAAGIASVTSISPRVSGPMPASQAAVATGSITK